MVPLLRRCTYLPGPQKACIAMDDRQRGRELVESQPKQSRPIGRPLGVVHNAVITPQVGCHEQSDTRGIATLTLDDPFATVAQQQADVTAGRVRFWKHTFAGRYAQRNWTLPSR